MKRRKMKFETYGYDTNRPWPKYGHKYTKCKICHITIMIIGIKQHLRNIWSSIHGKVNHHWDCVEKCVAHKKSM